MGYLYWHVPHLGSIGGALDRDVFHPVFVVSLGILSHEMSTPAFLALQRAHDYGLCTVQHEPQFQGKYDVRVEDTALVRASDADNDGDVDREDISLFSECINIGGKLRGPLCTEEAARIFDTDKDGDVDRKDFLRLIEAVEASHRLQDRSSVP